MYLKDIQSNSKLFEMKILLILELLYFFYEKNIKYPISVSQHKYPTITNKKVAKLRRMATWDERKRAIWKEISQEERTANETWNDQSRILWKEISEAEI
jgi:hypothetical protein